MSKYFSAAAAGALGSIPTESGAGAVPKILAAVTARGRVFTGANHAEATNKAEAQFGPDVFHEIVSNAGKPISEGGSTGFTVDGKFVSRMNALEVANKTDQIEDSMKNMAKKELQEGGLTTIGTYGLNHNMLKPLGAFAALPTESDATPMFRADARLREAHGMAPAVSKLEHPGTYREAFPEQYDDYPSEDTLRSYSPGPRGKLADQIQDAMMKVGLNPRYSRTIGDRLTGTDPKKISGLNYSMSPAEMGGLASLTGRTALAVPEIISEVGDIFHEYQGR